MTRPDSGLRLGITSFARSFAHEGAFMQHVVPCNVAALAIATLYYWWRDAYHRPKLAKAESKLHERVAYMLWVAATRA